MDDYRPGAVGGTAGGCGRVHRDNKKAPEGALNNLVRLRGAGLGVGIDADLEASLVLVLEFHDAID
jgi:hypothetical protein